MCGDSPRIVFVSATLTPYHLGRLAFLADKPRLVPQHLLVGDSPEVGAGEGIEAAREWYRGWDAANLAAPVPGIDE
jgi:hypothetical protein